MSRRRRHRRILGLLTIHTHSRHDEAKTNEGYLFVVVLLRPLPDSRCRYRQKVMILAPFGASPNNYRIRLFRFMWGRVPSITWAAPRYEA